MVYAFLSGVFQDLGGLEFEVWGFILFWVGSSALRC